MEEQNNTQTESKPTEPVIAGENTEATSKWPLFLGGFVLIAALAAGYWFTTQDNAPADGAAIEIEEVEAGQVVAVVNGTELYGKDLNPQIALIGAQGGVTDPSVLSPEAYVALRSQALDAIVNTTLLAQAAETAGITVTDEEISAQFNVMVDNIGGIEAAEARLEQLGVTFDEFKGTLRNDLLLQGYLEANNDFDVTVTEEEVQATYDSLVSTANVADPSQIPPFAEVQFQIQQQLQFQKQQQVIGSLLEELRANAEVELLL